MTLPTTTNTHLPANREANPYLDSDGFFGLTSNIVGHLLKFSKFGEFTAGQDNVPVPMGSKMIAHMGDLLVGWQRWDDNKPVEQIMGFKREGFEVPKRETLSHLDHATWEVDSKGKERDPWQKTAMLILKGADDDELYTFSTSSKGGLEACGKLSQAYGEAMRMHPDDFPVVQLGRSSYNHDEFGEIRKPMFTVVGWVPRKVMDDALAGQRDTGQEALPLHESPPKQSYADASGSSKKKTRF